MYKLKITAKAKRKLKQISKIYQQQAVHAALEDIKNDPHLLGKPLTRELTGKFTYKIGVYRVIYKIKEKEKIVFILSVGHRATVYL